MVIFQNLEGSIQNRVLFPFLSLKDLLVKVLMQFSVVFHIYRGIFSYLWSWCVL